MRTFLIFTISLLLPLLNDSNALALGEHSQARSHGLLKVRYPPESDDTGSAQENRYPDEQAMNEAGQREEEARRERQTTGTDGQDTTVDAEIGAALEEDEAGYGGGYSDGNRR